MILLADSASCSLVTLSDHVLVAQQQSIPVLGNPASLISLINSPVHSLAAEMGEKPTIHQQKLEQAYRS